MLELLEIKKEEIDFDEDDSSNDRPNTPDDSSEIPDTKGNIPIFDTKVDILDTKADTLDVPINTLVNLRSKHQYEKAYKRLHLWCEEKKIENFTEDVLLSYFEEKSEVLKSSTLWTHYSMLKASLIINDKIDIGTFSKLLEFLKLKSDGYRAKKCKTFTREQIEQFLADAPDEGYLIMKVALIMGIAGGCSRDELARLAIDDIKDLGTNILVKIPERKAKAQKKFTYIANSATCNMLDVYRKYAALRPSHTKHRRFFVYYKNGRCFTQVVGVNTFGKFPSQIAAFLQLPNPSLYGGNCYRKSSSILLSDGEADVIKIKASNMMEVLSSGGAGGIHDMFDSK